MFFASMDHWILKEHFPTEGTWKTLIKICFNAPKKNSFDTNCEDFFFFICNPTKICLSPKVRGSFRLD